MPLVRAGAGYRLDLDRISSAVTARTRALLITTPHNPTGVVLSAAELAAIGTIADRHDLAHYGRRPATAATTVR